MQTRKLQIPDPTYVYIYTQVFIHTVLHITQQLHTDNDAYAGPQKSIGQIHSSSISMLNQCNSMTGNWKQQHPCLEPPCLEPSEQPGCTGPAEQGANLVGGEALLITGA